MRIAIIGAGPAGLTCASSLLKHGYKNIDIYDSDDSVGGMCKSFKLWDRVVDLGPHRFFTYNSEIRDYWMDYASSDHITIDRVSRILYGNKYYDYPLKVGNVLKNLGLKESIRCLNSYFIAQLRGNSDNKDETFDQWVSKRFGKELYGIFFKEYSERLWGMPCDKIDADFARQRIKGLDLKEVIVESVFDRQGSRSESLADRFLYTKKGAGVPYENMAKNLSQAGISISLNSYVNKINLDSKNGGMIADGITMKDGTEKRYDYIVTSAPITDMIGEMDFLGRKTKDVTKELTYRNTILVFFLVKERDLFEDNWIYLHDRGINAGRITNFDNWTDRKDKRQEENILCMEYWADETDELWQLSDDAILKMGKDELTKTGLVHKNSIKDGHVVKLRKSYPVYRTGYKQKLLTLQLAVSKIDNLAFIGRNGSFKYNNQDHSMYMGLLAAENIVAETKIHDLWSVNSDSKYQEGKVS